jgi:hypothetical protein
MLRGGAEFQRQKALNRASNNWNKAFLCSTDIGLHRIGQAASTGTQSDLKDSTHWGWSCMFQLQEADNWEKPAATTLAAEFLLRDCEHRIKGEITGSAGKPVHGLNTTSSSKASKRWQEKQLERIADGKLN